MKRHTMLMVLITNHYNSEIANHLKVARCATCSKSEMSRKALTATCHPWPWEKKKYSKSSDILRTAKFIQQLQDIIKHNPSKSISIITKVAKDDSLISDMLYSKASDTSTMRLGESRQDTRVVGWGFSWSGHS